MEWEGKNFTAPLKIFYSRPLRHIPHVMTLFDRRVDLARFSETTPLYVMCREWMRNKPQKRQPQNSSVEQVRLSLFSSPFLHQFFSLTLRQTATFKIRNYLSNSNNNILFSLFTSLLSFPSPEPLGEGQSSSIPVALPPHGSARSLDHELEKQVQPNRFVPLLRHPLDFQLFNIDMQVVML